MTLNGNTGKNDNDEDLESSALDYNPCTLFFRSVFNHKAVTSLVNE